MKKSKNKIGRNRNIIKNSKKSPVTNASNRIVDTEKFAFGGGVNSIASGNGLATILGLTQDFINNYNVEDPVSDYINNKQKIRNNRPGVIQSPDQALVENDIAIAKATRKAENDPLSMILSAAGNTAMQVGMQGMSSSNPNETMSGGELAEDGFAGFLNKFVRTDGKGYQDEVKAFGGSVGQKKVEVEVEGNENAELPDGNLIDFQGPSHEEGGIDTILPSGTKVYSDRIEINGETMAQRKDKRTRKLDRAFKNVDNQPSSKIVKDTLDRIKQTTSKEESADMELQNIISQANSNNKFADGGIVGDNRYGDRYPIKYAHKKSLNDFSPYMDQYTNLTGLTNMDWGDTNNVKSFQKMIGTKEDGILGRDSLAKAQKYFSTAKRPQIDPVTGSSVGQINPDGSATYTTTNEVGAPELLLGNRNFSNTDSSEIVTGDQGISNNLPGVDNNSSDVPSDNINSTNNGTNGDNFTDVLRKTFGGMGDKLGMYGNIYGAWKNRDLTYQNRAGDQPNVNSFENYGKDGLEAMEAAKSHIRQAGDAAKYDIEAGRRSATSSNRNTARGVNTQRALDLASSMQAQKASADVNGTVGSQLADVLTKEAQLMNDRDRMVATGDQYRREADIMDRDNFFSNLAKNEQGIGEAIARTGKALNEIKTRETKATHMNQTTDHFNTDIHTGETTQKPGTIITSGGAKTEAALSNFETSGTYSKMGISKEMWEGYNDNQKKSILTAYQQKELEASKASKRAQNRRKNKKK